MARGKRITLTPTQAASAFGQRLIHMALSMSRDGEISIDEVRALHTLLKHGPDDFAAVPFLRSITTAVLVDGRLDDAEAYQLRRAIERVVPKAVRETIREFLSDFGEACDGEVEFPRGPWQDDPITSKQFAFIESLGGVPDEQMTKGQASRFIEDLLKRRPATPRQQMILRFFGRNDLITMSKEEASDWIDNCFCINEAHEAAWEKYKRDTGDDGTNLDPGTVPVGMYKNYLRHRSSEAPVTISKSRYQREGRDGYEPVIPIPAKRRLSGIQWAWIAAGAMGLGFVIVALLLTSTGR